MLPDQHDTGSSPLGDQPRTLYHVGRAEAEPGADPPTFLWSDLDSAREYAQGRFPIYKVDTSGLTLLPDEEYALGVAYYVAELLDRERFQPLDDDPWGF